MNISAYKVFIPDSENDVKKKSLGIANVLYLELANYGIELDTEAFGRLIKLKPKKAQEIAESILTEYTVGQINPPLFKNWEERTSFSWAERRIQILGYIFQFCGNDFEQEDFIANLKRNADFSKTKKLKLASNEEFTEYFENLVGSNVTFDKKTSNKLLSIFDYFEDELTKFPRIKSAEIRIAALLALVPKIGLKMALESLKCNSLDVLRYAAAKNDFQLFKLPADVKYAQLSWTERIDSFDFLNKRAEDFEAVNEDMGLNRAAWNRYLKHTHFFGQSNFINRFRNFYIAATVSLGSRLDQLNSRIVKNVKELIKNEEVELTEAGTLVYRTFASRIQKAIEEKNWATIKKLCQTKPGYFLRNITHISNGVSETEEKDFVKFAKSCITGADVNILFSILSIDVDAEYRIIDIKGNTVIEAANYNKVIRKIQHAIKEELRASYGFNGKVEVDGEIKHRIVPFLSKNADLERGTKIKLKDSPFLYFYVNWIEGSQRTDLDLSFIYLDHNWKMGIIDFRAQANSFLSHSGDFTSAPAPHGATEYGKIRLNSIPKHIKYIAPMINVFSGSEFSDNKEVKAGFLLSEQPKFTLDRDTVKYNLTQPAQANVPFILDVENQEIVVLDFNQRVRMSWTVDGYANDIKKLISAANTKNFITIKKLAEILSGDSDKVVARFTNKPQMENEYKPEDLFSIFGKSFV